MKSILIIFILLSSVLLVACTPATNEDTVTVSKTAVQAEFAKIGEYNRYSEDIKSSAYNSGVLLGQWNILMTQINKGNTVDFKDMQDIQQQYSSAFVLFKPKIEAYKKFIDTNEQLLKDFGVDTYAEKQASDELVAVQQQNVLDMKEYIDKGAVNSEIDLREYGLLVLNDSAGYDTVLLTKNLKASVDKGASLFLATNDTSKIGYALSKKGTQTIILDLDSGVSVELGKELKAIGDFNVFVRWGTNLNKQ